MAKLTERRHDQDGGDHHDRTTRDGRFRRGIAARPITTKAKMASRLTCGHEVKRGDPIVNRGNGWLCVGCGTVTTSGDR